MIDAHHHFWRYRAADFGWVTDEMAVLRRDFLPEDLEQAMSGAGVTGCISVQATQTVEETQWLLALAGKHPFIRGVVGWVPLRDPGLGQILDRFAGDPSFCGVREILQGSPEWEYFDSTEFHRGLHELTERGIPYDLLIFQSQLPIATRLVDAHPGQLFILDHLAKPEIGEVFPEAWGEGIAELSKRPNVLCKFSGLATEVRGREWSVDLLRPYFEIVLEAFGADRLLFGSDWPVCLLRSGYAHWVAAVKELAASLSTSEQAAIFSDTARRAYSLKSA
jgi:L-fuconolactonase